MENQGKHEVKFIPSGRGKAQCPPNPDYPNGVSMSTVADRKNLYCKIDLTYPAPECGMWSIKCKTCGFTVLVTAAGRPDDPVSLEVECLPIPNPTVQ
jgi:hypothetical protein